MVSALRLVALQILLEDAAGLWSRQQGSAVVATEGNEVQIACFLKPLQSPGHGWQDIHKSRAAL